MGIWEYSGYFVIIVVFLFVIISYPPNERRPFRF
jgi:hypothetical protein